MKSYVSMERKVCPVCGAEFDSGAILLDRRLRESMERTTVTGWQLCPEHEALRADGYIALVEARAPAEGETLTMETAYRLGRVVHIRETAFKRVFDLPTRNDQGALVPLMFIDPVAFDRLEAMA